MPTSFPQLHVHVYYSIHFCPLYYHSIIIILPSCSLFVTLLFPPMKDEPMNDEPMNDHPCSHVPQDSPAARLLPHEHEPMSQIFPVCLVTLSLSESVFANCLSPTPLFSFFVSLRSVHFAPTFIALIWCRQYPPPPFS